MTKAKIIECHINDYGHYHKLDGPALIYDDGFEHWFKDGYEHRENGPAIIGPDCEEWYYNGKLHRKDGPASIRHDRTVWFLNGMIHRIGGPAVVYPDGGEEWWRYAELDRDDGPAITKHVSNGYIRYEYWQMDHCHRMDGPAICYNDQFYIDNKDVSIYNPYILFNENEEYYNEYRMNHEDFTQEVEDWLAENNITYPFTKEETILFKLRWN